MRNLICLLLLLTYRQVFVPFGLIALISYQWFFCALSVLRLDRSIYTMHTLRGF